MCVVHVALLLARSHASAPPSQGLSKLTADPDPAVREQVCMSLVSLTDDRLDMLMPHIDAIISFMLHSCEVRHCSVCVCRAVVFDAHHVLPFCVCCNRRTPMQ